MLHRSCGLWCCDEPSVSAHPAPGPTSPVTACDEQCHQFRQPLRPPPPTAARLFSGPGSSSGSRTFSVFSGGVPGSLLPCPRQPPWDTATVTLWRRGAVFTPGLESSCCSGARDLPCGPKRPRVFSRPASSLPRAGLSPLRARLRPTLGLDTVTQSNLVPGLTPPAVTKR